MMMDILLTNREAVMEAVAHMQQELGELGRLLAEGKDHQLQEVLEQARDRRVEVYR